MTIHYTCPHCNKPHEFTDDMAGEYMPCPNCERLISIPKRQKPESSTETESNPVPQKPTPTTIQKVYVVPVKISAMAITSMIVGLLGATVGILLRLPITMPIIAIILGHIAYWRIEQKPLELSGRGLAIAGFTMGYLGVVFGIIIMIFMNEISKAFEQLAN